MIDKYHAFIDTNRFPQYKINLIKTLEKTRFDKCNCKFCTDIIKAIKDKKDMLDDE